MNVVLTWVKANLFIVVFGAIMIIVPVLMWFVAGSMNDDVRTEVAKRASLIQDMDRHRQVLVSMVNPVPGNEPISDSVVLNPRLLDRFRATTGIIRGDAERIREEAVQFNRKQRGVLVPDLFPAPPEHRLETLPLEMHRTLDAAYQQLLDEVQAGSPPSPNEVSENIEAARERLTTQLLVEDMTPEDEAWLAEQLANTRLSQYADAAAAIGIYASSCSNGNGSIGSFRTFCLPCTRPTTIPPPSSMRPRNAWSRSICLQTPVMWHPPHLRPADAAWGLPADRRPTQDRPRPLPRPLILQSRSR